MTLKERARRLKPDIPALFPALTDPETPYAARAMSGITVACALSPMDPVPDFIPVPGYPDDAPLLPAPVALTVRLIPGEVLARFRRRAEGLWAGGRPRRRYCALPIVIVPVIRWIL